MNASTFEGGVRSPMAAPHATHKFKLLLRREFWEHKGGFFWAPVITGAIFSVMAILGAIVGVTQIRAHTAGHNINMHGGDAHFQVGDAALMLGVAIAFAVMTFVVFFYAIGSINDERKDRSILFWKSMPVADGLVVASKAAWALLLAPAVALGIGLVLGAVLWLIGGVATAATGIAQLQGEASHPIRLLGYLLLDIPMYALWALPTVGWLMFCSAWARSKPFLWAILLPVLGCVAISFLDVFPGIEIPHGSVWYAIAFRGLLSVIPGGWRHIGGNDVAIHNPGELINLVSPQANLAALGSADLWIGAVIGAALIYGAIHFRRWRDEG
jgi:ABC-2 type transport system permease protein